MNALHLSQITMKEYSDVNHHKPNFKVGDELWLSSTQGAKLRRIKYPLLGNTDELIPKQVGPFKIL